MRRISEALIETCSHLCDLQQPLQATEPCAHPDFQDKVVPGSLTQQQPAPSPTPLTNCGWKRSPTKRTLLLLRIRQPTSDLWRLRSTTAGGLLAQWVKNMKYARRAEGSDYADDADEGQDHKLGLCLFLNAKI